VPGLGTSFGRGGAATAQQDLSNADAILIMGSSMAENHPVGFQWVMEARERGAKILIHDSIELPPWPISGSRCAPDRTFFSSVG
jgi:anaerobic selenocysteine-containing dehydrogenase